MIDNAPVIAQPVLVDRVIYELQSALKVNLAWLDASFGRIQKITRTVDGKKYTLPNVYCGGLENKGSNDYIELSPDANIGNFCFFEVSDPQTIAWENGVQMTVATPFALVFWFDTRKVFGTATNRNTETLKNDILTLLNGRNGWHLLHGRVEVTKCFEDAKNVYRGYTLDEVDNQFLMHPYAGFRFEGTIEAEQPCQYESPAIRLYDTRDATATPENLASGKTAYNVNGKITGTGEITNLQEKTVTPTAGQQVVTPDSDHNGLSRVVVNATPLQTKSATPSISAQTVTPDADKVGLSQVSISAVDATIDQNIIATNIRQDITILGVTGSVVETNVVTMTQAQYDALAVKDPNTIYLILN